MSFTSLQLASYVSGELVGDGSALCCGAEIDTRREMRGKIFFALEGEHQDGHAYINEAVSKGCAAVVVSQNIKTSVPVIKVCCPRKALFDLAVARRNNIRGQVIAITGSVGKTTTKDIASHLLGTRAVSSPKSFNNELGVPLTLLAAENADFIVVEVGANEVGEISKLASLVRPHVAVITAIAPAHLKGFGSLDAILKEKTSLLQALPNDGVAVVAEGIELSHMNLASQVIRVGTTSSADIKIDIGISKQGFATILLNSNDFILSLLGSHNSINATLAVVAVQKLLSRVGMHRPIPDLLAEACNVPPTEGRMQSQSHGNINFINDSYNANPASMKSLLKFARVSEVRRKILVLGDMLELGEASETEHQLLAREIKLVQADIVFLIGPNMNSVAKCLSNAIYQPKADQETFDSIAALCKPGDTIYIKGSRKLKLERIIKTCSRIKVS